MIEEDLYSRASKRLSVLRTHLNNSLIEETWLLKNYANERKRIHEKRKIITDEIYDWLGKTKSR